MTNLNRSTRIRSLLARGTKALAFTSVLLATVSCSHGKTDTDTISSRAEVTTTCITSTTTSTSTTSTTSSTTTSAIMTTTAATTTPIITTMMIVQESIQVTEPVCLAPVQEPVESDVILMAQVINKEASASYDGKLAVASVIANRSNYFGQTIPEVIYAPNQFSVVGNLGTYTTDDYNAALQVLTSGSVNNAYYFDGGHSDGLNHFRDINNNYVGAW